MEACALKQETQNNKAGRRLLGKKLRFVQKVQPAESAKQAGGVNGAKNGDYEGFDEEDLKERMDAENRWWVTELVGGRLRKRGSIQDGKTPCRSGMTGWRK